MAFRKLKVDRLHIASMCLTLIAVILAFTGVLLPHFWVLRDYKSTTIATFSLFDDIRCTHALCYPPKDPAADSTAEPEPTAVPEPTTASGPEVNPMEEGGESVAGWLMAGRILGIVTCLLCTLPLFLQLAFFKLNYYNVQVVVTVLLIAAALFSYITGFLFINKYSNLTQMYINERPRGTLTYTPAAAGCVLISSLMCVVATVFTSFAFHPPERNKLIGGK